MPGATSKAKYCLEGNIYVTGAAVQWLSDLLGLGAPEKVEALAAQAEDNGGVYFVPALAGLGAPYWNDAARGLITGLTRGSTAAQVARATQESIVYQIRDVFETMQAEAGSPLQVLLVDGGSDPQRGPDAVPGGHPRRAGAAQPGERRVCRWARPIWLA